MFSTKFILTALTYAAVSYAAPGHPAPLAAPTITVCSGYLHPPQGCITLPIGSDACTSFTGGLSFLNKEVSWVEVPGGFVCTFFQDAGCINGGVNQHDVAVLQGGDWNMFYVQGIAGTQNFNDLASSFSCSPV